jgi:hypothetical protein
MYLNSLNGLKKYGWKPVKPEDIGITPEWMRAWQNDPKYREFCERMSRAKRESYQRARFIFVD